MNAQKWLLPDYLSDILPAKARRIESLRRRLLDLYQVHGFELVMPPLVEYTDSLLAVQQEALSLQTCQLVDQISGRTMGVRADITPQMTRIDAHLLNREGVTRLCYAGSVLHAKPSDLLAERELLQIGAEIYGYASVEADYQIIQLAKESLRLAGVHHSRLDLNHPQIAKSVIDAFPFEDDEVLALYEGLKQKDMVAISTIVSRYPEMPDDIRRGLFALPSLYGGIDVLQRAKTCLPNKAKIHESLYALQDIVDLLGDKEVSIDLADVTGYAYHTGVIFALYADGWHDALVRGGRYDNVGAVFGRARPATGFSLDLRKLCAGLGTEPPKRAILAPWSTDQQLNAKMELLRQAGQVVVQAFPNSQFSVDEFIFDQELVFENGEWVLKNLC